MTVSNIQPLSPIVFYLVIIQYSNAIRDVFKLFAVFFLLLSYNPSHESVDRMWKHKYFSKITLCAPFLYGDFLAIRYSLFLDCFSQKPCSWKEMRIQFDWGARYRMKMKRVMSYVSSIFFVVSLITSQFRVSASKHSSLDENSKISSFLYQIKTRHFFCCRFAFLHAYINELPRVLQCTYFLKRKILPLANSNFIDNNVMTRV